MSNENAAETEWRADLMWAIENNEPERVPALAADHDLNFADDVSGFTPLMLAVDASADGANQQRTVPDVTLVELLLSLGASPTMKGRNGEDATDVARNYHWHEAIDAMHAADPEGVPRMFWPLGYVDRIRMAVPIQHDEDTPWRAELMDAIKRTDVGRVRRLLADQQGSLDFVHPGSSLTPLQLAVSEPSRDRHPVSSRDATIVRLLLARRATPDMPLDPWSSPIKRAERWPEVAAPLLAERIGK